MHVEIWSDIVCPWCSVGKRRFEAALAAFEHRDEVSVTFAGDVGLDGDEVRETLATDRFAAEVREDERTASALGISAVPCFVIDRRMGAPGAQPPEVLTAFLQRGWDARSPLEVVASGDACGPDGC
jgi:predicted DsbA family dithiol-disulfide isomerase